MAEIINLRAARKVRARAQAEQQAAENRAKFGRTKSQKLADRGESERAAALLENARREPASPAED